MSAHLYTDFWTVYQAAVPAERHTQVGEGSGLTNHVERFWCPVRQW